MSASCPCRVILVVMLTAVAAGAAVGLELWAEDGPALPSGARAVSTDRTVLVRNGVALETEARRHERIRRESPDEIVRTVYDADGEFLWDAVFRYEGGRLVGIRAVDPDERWRLAFEYDEEGRPVRESHYRRDGVPERTIAYEYGPIATEVISYRADGSVAWRRTESKGDAGDERETTFYYADGTRIKTIVAILDEEGRPVVERHLDELGATYRTVEREYAPEGPVEELVRVDGNVVRTTGWEYDEAGRPVQRRVELPGEGREEWFTVSFSFNDRGHWTERMETSFARYDEEEAFVTDQVLLERHIEYE